MHFIERKNKVEARCNHAVIDLWKLMIIQFQFLCALKILKDPNVAFTKDMVACSTI